MAHQNWLIYGAYGYTGRLVTATAVERGHRPVLAGRSEGPLREMAEKYDLDYRTLAVEDSLGLRRAFAEVDTVVNLAGPFTHTAVPVAEACLAAGSGYVDVSGDLPVPPALFALDERAREAGVVILPSAGWEAVPTSCLTGLLHKQMPDATSLELATAGLGRGSGKWSRGSLRTFFESMGRNEGNLVLRSGVLVPADPPPTITVHFPIGDRKVTALAWVDLELAHRDTGIGDVTFYRPEELQEQAVRRLARLPGGLRALRALVRAWPGPSPDDRADTVLFVWGRVSNARDESVCHVLTTPNGYAFTADALVRVVDRLGSQTIPPGAHSPLSALGAEFVLECDGVHLDPEPFELRE